MVSALMGATKERSMDMDKKLHPMLVEVPAHLHRAVKIRAAQDGTSIRALIAEGMRLVTAPRKSTDADLETTTK
jgi:predicted HicB family RNase H-like nuclease